MIIDNHGPELDSLKSRWQNLLASYDVNQQTSEQLFQEIITAYGQSHRQYHNLNHLSHMFQELDSYETDSGKTGVYEKISNEMLWAVWYHDFIYKPGAKTNEKKSANKANESMCKLGIQQSSIEEVVSLILATENHQSELNESKTQLFLDADMAILGSDELSYSKYYNAVRQEHSSIPDFLFNKGRKKFLSTVLAQESIFMSSFFKEKYEQTARNNIKVELCVLNKTRLPTFAIEVERDSHD